MSTRSAPASMAFRTRLGARLLLGTSNHSGSTIPCSASRRRSSIRPPPVVLPVCATTATVVIRCPLVGRRPHGDRRRHERSGAEHDAPRHVGHVVHAGIDATKIGIAIATAHTIAPSHRRRTCGVRIIASPTYRTIAAAACPDGKLEVGGEGFQLWHGGPLARHEHRGQQEHRHLDGERDHQEPRVSRRLPGTRSRRSRRPR